MLKDRKDLRLKNYDYSSPGKYFITVCTKERGEWFGKIINSSMHYSDHGKIAATIWVRTSACYKNIFVDSWVLMPNHLHALLIIKDSLSVGTGPCPVLLEKKNINKSYGMISKAIKSFKEVTTKRIRKELKNYQFSWQRSFHDRIVKDDETLYKVRQYIKDNPKN